MSSPQDIRFFVKQEVLDIGVRIVFAVVENIDNKTINPQWMGKRKTRINKLLDRYQDIDYHSDPILEGFNILHDHSGDQLRLYGGSPCH